MKNSIKTFDKLIEAKEREKQSILTHCTTLQKRFEEIGNKLYELVKKEEKAKEHLNELIKSGTMYEIQQQNHFIQLLDPMIRHQEAIYKQTKDELHIEKLKLMKKTVEMKKFEKVKDKKIETLSQIEKAKEAKEIDEISINQFMKSMVMT